MNESARDALFSELLERPDQRERLLDEARLTDSERAQIRELLEAADAVWMSAHGAPAIQDDKVAAMLGLIPNADCRLDRKLLTQARKRARLSVSDLAVRLSARGWEVSSGDVFRWENRSAELVPPALIEAIANVVESPVERLLTTPMPETVDEFREVRRHPRFAELVDRWATIQHVSRSVAASILESRAVATVHRGEQPNPDQLIHSLEALVASVEAANEK